MNVYESIMQGLTEALEYTQGKNTARSMHITITPPPEISADEIKQSKLGKKKQIHQPEQQNE